MGAFDSYGMIPFSEEHRMLREMLRKYCNEKLRPAGDGAGRAEAVSG